MFMGNIIQHDINFRHHFNICNQKSIGFIFSLLLLRLKSKNKLRYILDISARDYIAKAKERARKFIKKHHWAPKKL